GCNNGVTDIRLRCISLDLPPRNANAGLEANKDAALSAPAWLSTLSLMPHSRFGGGVNADFQNLKKGVGVGAAIRQPARARLQRRQADIVKVDEELSKPTDTDGQAAWRMTWRTRANTSQPSMRKVVRLVS